MNNLFISYTDNVVSWVPRKNTQAIFLAGPTAREGQTVTWRKDALELLELAKFNGVVYVPEYDPNKPKPNLSKTQAYEWKNEALALSTKILFWIPRDLKNGILGLTTNIEFGRYLFTVPEKCFYGRPLSSDNNAYLDYWYFQKTNRKPQSTLTELIEEVLQ